MSKQTLILINKKEKMISKNTTKKSIELIYNYINKEIKTPFINIKHNNSEHVFYSEVVDNIDFNNIHIADFISLDRFLNEIKKEPEHIQNIINHILIKHKLISETK